MRELLLFVKYPYTALVIGTIWLGTAALIGLNRDLPIIRMVIINMFASLTIAVLGFRGKKEM